VPAADSEPATVWVYVADVVPVLDAVSTPDDVAVLVSDMVPVRYTPDAVTVPEPVTVDPTVVVRVAVVPLVMVWLLVAVRSTVDVDVHTTPVAV
jgi:hypothetical protein